jgi:hypothetical protein
MEEMVQQQQVGDMIAPRARGASSSNRKGEAHMELNRVRDRLDAAMRLFETNHELSAAPAARHADGQK